LEFSLSLLLEKWGSFCNLLFLWFSNVKKFDGQKSLFVRIGFLHSSRICRLSLSVSNVFHNMACSFSFSLWFVCPRFFFFLFLFSFRESFFYGFGMQLFNSITIRSYGNSIYSNFILWPATKTLLFCIELLWDYSETCWLGTLKCNFDSSDANFGRLFWLLKKIISIVVKK